MRTIGIALLGLGNVGGGVVRLLSEHGAAIRGRFGATFALRGVLVRDTAAKRQVSVDERLLTDDPSQLLRSSDVDVVVELIGGVDRAYELVAAAISAGKHVVTANKALIAERGEELFVAAAKAGVGIYYEAAVCGGVPVIRSLREGLASDQVESITGIVNGTSNYVCTELSKGGREFGDVVREAQKAGFAEMDPTLDISGMDAAQKLCILAKLCFGVSAVPKDIYVEGIDQLTAADFGYAHSVGSTIKPLVLATEYDEGLALRVHPAMIPNRWLLADVPGAMNAVYVRSRALGASMYYGAGAGMMPTAMAVVSDVIELSRNLLGGVGGVPSRATTVAEAPPLLPIEDTESRFFLRLRLDDQPGALGKLATVLGTHKVSIAALEQEPGAADPNGKVEVCVQTHRCAEKTHASCVPRA